MIFPIKVKINNNYYKYLGFRKKRAKNRLESNKYHYPHHSLAIIKTGIIFSNI